MAAQPDDAVVEFARRVLDRDILGDDVRAEPPTKETHLKVAQALQRAAIDPDANDYDTLILVIADLLRRGEALPGWLATFAADVLGGQRKRPTRRGRDEYANWQRDYKLWRVTEEVATTYALPRYTNNELSEKPTAAHAVAIAARCSYDVVVRACRRFNPGRG
jgi:hypothetical protein